MEWRAEKASWRKYVSSMIQSSEDDERKSTWEDWGIKYHGAFRDIQGILRS